jgi:hypothetical protein
VISAIQTLAESKVGPPLLKCPATARSTQDHRLVNVRAWGVLTGAEAMATRLKFTSDPVGDSFVMFVTVEKCLVGADDLGVFVETAFAAHSFIFMSHTRTTRSSLTIFSPSVY